MKFSLSFIFSLIVFFFLTGCGGSSVDADTTPDDNTTVIDDTNTSDDNGTVDDNTTDDNSTSEDNETIFPNAVLHDAAFISDHFSGSKNCALCHDGLTDQNNNDVSIHKSWHSSMMANASVDPMWQAKVASEAKRNPHVSGIIEEKCSRCHTPMANVEAKFAGEDPTLLGDGFLNPENPHYDEAMNGVSCTLCHQIENTPQLGTIDGFSGGFEIADKLLEDRTLYGPYADPVAGPMINNVSFTPTYSAHTNDSKLCASCHNLDTPVLHPNGELAGIYFPEQAPYTEWEYSDYNGTAQNCQSCHMPISEGSVILSTRPDNGSLTPRPEFHQHQFIGANTYMLNIIKNNKATLGALADEASFDQTIANTRALLMAAADINITSADFNDGTLRFSVTVTNHSGHKFPTGIPTRRAWIHVTVSDAQNNIVFESGALSEDGRKIIGVDETEEEEGSYEPHYDKITDDAQVQIYEGIMADTEGHLTYTLLHAAQYLKDNRILPRGMDKTRIDLPKSAQTFGLAREDSDFIGGSDSVDYEIASLPNSSYTITVTLMYQTISYGFAEDLFEDDDLPEVALMESLHEKSTLHSEKVSADQVVVDILP